MVRCSGGNRYRYFHEGQLCAVEGELQTKLIPKNSADGSDAKVKESEVSVKRIISQ